MGGTCQSIARTVAEIIERRPVLEPVLKTFQPLFEAGKNLCPDLVRVSQSIHLHFPEFQRERAANGVSLLADMELNGVAPVIETSARTMIHVLASLEAVSPWQSALEKLFLAPEKGTPDSGEVLMRAVLTGATESVSELARHYGIPPEHLMFSSGFILSPVLHAWCSLLGGETGQFPWDEEGVWGQGYCPVCGSFPTIGWLDRPSYDEKNAYLSGGGGKKHLHCSLCGANWKLRRGVCPSCGREGDGVLEILRESNGNKGERLDWCTKCKSYCPIVDLREREGVPDMDVMALGMMHLDMVASRKKLRPLTPSFWNMF